MSAWRGKSVGAAPYEVTPVERADKGGRLYLRWRGKSEGAARTNWRYQSLRDHNNRPVLARTADGKLVKARTEWAQRCAEDKARELAETAGVGRVVDEAPCALTILEGKRRAFDRNTGKYPTRTQHRDEVSRALDFAALTWAAMEPPVTAWVQVRKAHIRALGRERIRALRRRRDVDGFRAAEITVMRVLAVAQWLRDEEIIPPGACVAPKDWRAKLKEDWIAITEAPDVPEPRRPRHTIQEMRAIMAKARDVDPRFEVLIAIGAEQRLGQVRRAWRSAYDRAKGLFRIPSRGKKQGALLELTRGQIAVLERALTVGYLRHLERLELDYPLFPGRELVYTERGEGKGRSGSRGSDPIATQRHLKYPTVSRMKIRLWFHDAEALAKVPHVHGRGAYGLRRVAVDAAVAEKISPDGLQAHGGWTNSKTPNEIYRETERVEARSEAKDVRAKIRGERE
ncbi:MAG TPA: hypothetical protein VEB19_08315 [Gemmatimonadaceae bacterium]|nr:hypothetical protein [Gemmatimonadaceae bacterium]